MMQSASSWIDQFGRQKRKLRISVTDRCNFKCVYCMPEHPEWVKTATNKTLDDFTLENVLSNKVTAQDMRITPETLRLQAEIAKDAGRDRLAMNFERAAELTAVPDDRILEIYNALRPYRSTKDELMAIADDLENRYQAKICAAFVREAAALYVERKKLKGDD